MPRLGSLRVLLALMLAGLLVSSCSSGGTSVTGEITKKDRMAIPPDSVVTVELRDISLADAPAMVLASQVVEMDGNQLPAPYELPYDENEIDERNTYTVFSRIESGGRLIYITDTVYPVITNGAPTEDVMVFVVQTG